MAGKLRLFFGLAIPIAGVVYGLWRLREWQLSEEKRIEESTVVVPLSLTQSLPLPAEAGAVRAPTAPSYERPGAARTSGSPVLDGTTVVLEGTASLVDADGTERRTENGAFELTVQLLDGEEPFAGTQPVLVEVGRWTATQTLPRAPRLSDLRWSARSLVLRGQPVRSPVLSVGEDTLHRVPENGVIALAGRVVRPSIVHVLASDTRAELHAVEVRTRAHGEARTPDHRLSDLSEPSEATVERLLPSTQSPIELSEASPPASPRGPEGSDQASRSGLALYWMRAPGYAWGRIAIDHERGGERTLVLERSGALVARLESWSASRDLRVRVYRRVEKEIGALAAQREPPPSGVARFEGLLPGRYEVRAEIGRALPGDRPQVLRSIPCEVRAQNTTELRLALKLPPKPIPAPLAGTLTWPLAWRAVEAELVITPYDALPTRPGWSWRSAVAKLRGRAAEDQALAWKAGDVGPGKYLFEVRPLRHFELVDVGARGSIFTSIEIPRDWSGVRIQLSDPGSTKATPVRWLLWQRTQGEPALVAPFASLAAKTPDVFYLSTLPGDVRIAAVNRSHRYALSSQVVTSRSGGAEVALQVSPACRLCLRVRQHGGDVPAEPSWLAALAIRRVAQGTVGPPLTWPFEMTRHDVDPVLYDPAHDVEAPPFSPDGTHPEPTRAALFDVDAPGEYEIVFPPIAGMRPIAPRRVTLAREAPVEVVVELERAE